MGGHPRKSNPKVSMRTHWAARATKEKGDELKRCMVAIEWWWNGHTRAVLRHIAGGHEGAFCGQQYSSSYIFQVEILTVPSQARFSSF